MLGSFLPGFGRRSPVCFHHLWLEQDRTVTAAVKIGNGTPLHQSQAVSSDAAFAVRRAVLPDGEVNDRNPTVALGDYRRWPLADPASVMLICCTTPKRITMARPDFAAYLQEEGLPHTMLPDTAEVTEEYRKCAKLLLRASPIQAAQAIAPATYAEITAARTFEFCFLFDRRPLAAVQLTLASRNDRQSATTDDGGKASFKPVSGDWCVYGLTMFKTSGPFQRQSFWASLSGSGWPADHS